MDEPSRWARRAIEHVERLCSGGPLDRDLRITLNFHVDRQHGGRSVLDGLAEGFYRSQFETGTSNGGLTAHPGGDRWLWERTLFGGAYDDAPPQERPKYGALDHRRRPLGGAPRFGSCHLRLKEHMLDRATFCFPDSAFAPTRFATAHRFALLPVPLLGDVCAAASAPGRDPLDGYVEAHVHGRIAMATDVEALVLDPCYRGTSVHEQALRLGVPVEWHEGRVVATSTLDEHRDYRGEEPVRLGHRIARAGLVDALVIGDAVRSGRHDPQHLKQLWHLTAQWGSPRRPAPEVTQRGR